MKDTIYRQDAIDVHCEICGDRGRCNSDICLDMKVFQLLPPARSEQKIGKFIRWMEKKETSDYISFTPHCKCSLCGNELLIENINYCYMCGASLIEDREAERMEE